MKGSYRIVVQNSKIRYDFEINRNITVIKGDSATGKTTLVELISGIITDKEVQFILEKPQNYIECSAYFSWERFFTALLIEKTKQSYMQYTKHKLNSVYLRKRESQLICE